MLIQSLVGLEFFASCRAERIFLGMICWCYLGKVGRRPSVVYAETLLTANGFGLSITRILNILSKMQVVSGHALPYAMVADRFGPGEEAKSPKSAQGVGVAFDN